MAELGGNTWGARHAARAQREQYVAALASGDISFTQVVGMSRQEEFKALRLVKLMDVLQRRSGWTETTSYEALAHAGFTVKDTILSIRKSPTKVRLFETICTAPAAQWRARPKVPAGWPFQGKLRLLLKEAGADIPEELDEVDPEESPFQSQLPRQVDRDSAPSALDLLLMDDSSQAHDPLAALLAGDD